MTAYLDLADYLLIAEAVTGIDAAVLAKASRIDLAESALNAPRAEFDGVEFYPEFVTKAGRPLRPPGLEPSASRRQQTGRLGVIAGILCPERLPPHRPVSR